MRLPLTAYGNVLPSTFWVGIEDIPANYVDGLSIGDFVAEGHPRKALEALICLPETERNSIFEYGNKAGERLAHYLNSVDATIYADATTAIVNGENPDFRVLRTSIVNANDEVFNNAIVSFHQFKKSTDNIRGLVRRLNVLLTNVLAVAEIVDETFAETTAVGGALLVIYPATKAAE